MKRAVKGEIDSNFARYRSEWPVQKRQAFSTLESHTDIFKHSYRRLTSLQAWRTILQNELENEESLSFLLEAQNDGICSHVLAQFGMWRLALQSLRSCLENCCLFLYYKDHPVELEQWKSGMHSLMLRDIREYFGKHPSIASTATDINALSYLSQQFNTLSKAVHGATQDFRMTDHTNFPNLFDTCRKQLKLWEDNEKRTLEAINLLMVVLFKEQLSGTRQSQLREIISGLLSPHLRTRIKENFKVNLE